MGWVGNVFLILGLLFLSPKTKWPFICTIVGEVIWSVYSYQTSQWDMMFICVVFAMLSVKNFLKWDQLNDTP